MAFHSAIASIGRNSACEMLSEAMLDWLFHFRRDLLRMPGSEIVTMSEHRRIQAAIAAHDVEEAERAMTDHLTRSGQRYRIIEDAMLGRQQRSVRNGHPPPESSSRLPFAEWRKTKDEQL